MRGVQGVDALRARVEWVREGGRVEATRRGGRARGHALRGGALRGARRGRRVEATHWVGARGDALKEHARRDAS